MKRFQQLSLATRLSVAFSLISCMVFSSIAVLSYLNMKDMLNQQQNQILQARIQRIELFLEDANTFQILIQHPKLYENMLGQQDSLLILKNTKQNLIGINPLDIQFPKLIYSDHIKFIDNQNKNASTRLAYKQVSFEGQLYQLIAGKQLYEIQHILNQYIWTLVLNSFIGILISSLLGWWVGHYLLRSMKALIVETSQINVQKLSHRIQLESNNLEVNQLTQAMNEMLEKIQVSYMQLARFSEDIAHELRTPLNNLMGQTQIILTKSRDKQDLENLLYSHLEEYERLSKMTENMLFIARSEQFEQQIKKQPLDLKGLISSLIDYLNFLAERKNIFLDVRMNEDLRIFANADLIKRALSNLIINAIDYGEENGQIIITAQQKKSSLDISVLSRDIFIEDKHLKYLFDRFYQVDESRHDKARTGGLGLAIVRSIMNLHHGHVTVGNSDQGVIFTLILLVE